VTGSTRHRVGSYVRTCHRQAAPLWLRLVGSLEVCRGGEPVSGTAVGNRKARALLALLAVRRGSLIGVSTVVDTLWSEPWPRDPAANVATLVSRLRASLGAEVILGGRSGYRLGDAVGTDLHDSARLVATARAGLAGGKPEGALSSARRAVALLDDGPLLADFPDAGWSMPFRAHHIALLRRARLAMAAAALGTGDVLTAQDAAAAAAAADPLDESAVRALMRAYVACGEPAKALIAYGQLRTRLADELGIDPTAATAELHVAILRGGVDPPVRREIGPSVG
jgi:DNA-binding SARP family transcriptional activator